MILRIKMRIKDMKNNKFLNILFCAIFSFAVCIGSVMPCFAADDSGQEGEAAALSQSVVLEYVASKNKIVKGDRVNISVTVRNYKLLTSQCSEIDIAKTKDSFRGSDVSYKIVSSSNELLKYTVRFENIIYSGKGNELNFAVFYNEAGNDPEALSVVIDECREDSSGNDAEPGTETEKNPVSEPETERDNTDKSATSKETPFILIDRSPTEPVKAGGNFSVDISFTNKSANTVFNGVAVLEPGEGLVLNENKTSKTIGTIKPGATTAVTVHLKAASSVSSANLELSVSFKYSYDDGGARQEATESEKLIIPCSKSGGSAKSDSPATPNIIVSGYSYGGKSVSAGEKFNLSITFKNTSSETAVENIVMSVATDENISITSGSNAFYIAKIAPGASQRQTMEMQALANAVTGSAKTTVTFAYEYVKGSERVSFQTSESLSIPVYLPDRFSILKPEEIEAEQGKEVNLSIPYINKGKGSASNVSAELVFKNPDDVFIENSSQNLGNIEPGKSGTIDFFFTPNITGTLSYKVIVTYEDDMSFEKTVELPFETEIAESAEDFGEGGFMGEEDFEEEAGLPLWAKILIIAGASALVISGAVAAVVLKKKSKKKSNDIPDDFDWDNREN